ASRRWMSAWGTLCRPARLPTEIRRASGRQWSSSPGAARLSWNTTSAACRARRPRTVIRSGSPGPAPTSQTCPVRPAAGGAAASVEKAGGTAGPGRGSGSGGGRMVGLLGARGFGAADAQDAVGVHAQRPAAHAHGGVFQACSGVQAEMLLVHGRGDDRMALEFADDAARQDGRAAEGIDVVEGERARLRQE